MLANPLQRELLPVGVALRRVDAQHVGTGLHQRRHALGVVARVDARTHLVALVRVQHLVGVGLMGVVVLAEHQVHQVVLVVHHGQRVQLVVPDDVVGNLQAGVHGRHDHVLARRHEAGHLLVHGHARQAVVAVRHHAHQLAVRRAVLGHGHGGVAVLVLEGHHVGERHLGREVRIARHEAGLVVLHARDHGRLILDALRAVDERQAALGGQRDGHAVVGHGLHDGGHHGDVQRDGRFLATAVLHERRLQAHILRDTFCRRVTGYQQVLVERAGRLIEIVGHELLHLRSARSARAGCGADTIGAARHRPPKPVKHPLLRCYPLL